MRLRFDEVVTALSPLLITPAHEPSVPFEIHSVTYDSREVGPSSLFACIQGERTDGHLFAAAAESAGAVCVLAERALPELEVPVLVVKDTVTALTYLSAYARSKTKAKVVGLTGTSGKTTVKELIASILQVRGKTAKSLANHNNQLGMSCGILNCDGDEEFWVFEAGISHPRDMDELGAMLKPDLALILNVGEGHTEFLGDKGVAWYKTRFLLHLAEKGTAIVSADYPDLVWKAFQTHVSPLIFFSAKEGVVKSGDDSANFAVWEGETSEGFGRFRLSLQGEDFSVTAPVSGAYAAEDVIAAALVARTLGLSLEEIQLGLRQATLPAQRFHRHRLGGLTLIDDSYNANPLSMLRMLDAACDPGRPLLCVLGEMRELGEDSLRLHRELGAAVAAKKACAVFWKGAAFEAFSKGLADGGYTGPLTAFESLEAFQTSFTELFSQDSSLQKAVILVKGSRANKLEEVVSYLLEALPGLGKRAAAEGADHVL